MIAMWVPIIFFALRSCGGHHITEHYGRCGSDSGSGRSVGVRAVVLIRGTVEGWASSGYGDGDGDGYGQDVV